MPTANPTVSPTCCTITEEELANGCPAVLAANYTLSQQLCRFDGEIAAVCRCSCCQLTPAPTSAPTTPVPTASPTIDVCECPLDLMFLVDASASITPERFYNESLAFAVGMLARLNVGENRSRVAVATFSSIGGADIAIPLDNTLSRTDLIESIRRDVPFIGGLTFVRTALSDVREHLTQDGTRATSTFPAQPVLVTLLDGAFTAGIYDTESGFFLRYDIFLQEANLIRSAGIHSYAVLLPHIGVTLNPFTSLPLSRQQRLKSALILSTDPNVNTTRYFFEGATNGTILDLVATVSNRVCGNAKVDGTCQTAAPTLSPTHAPSLGPTQQPTAAPTMPPTSGPTRWPSSSPTRFPSLVPSSSPTPAPSRAPTSTPTDDPTTYPTTNPTGDPTANPTTRPTIMPTSHPTNAPTTNPTTHPTTPPTAAPSANPTAAPTFNPTFHPTANPTINPTSNPSAYPTAHPTADPTFIPTGNPTANPTANPTSDPTADPSVTPTFYPTSTPTYSPTHLPTVSPSMLPTKAPSTSPTTLQCFLDIAVHRQPNRPDEDDAYCFDGGSGLQIAAAPALPQEFIIELEFRLTLGTGGFLFSKAASSASRFLAIEALEGQLGSVLYFRTQGSADEVRSVLPEIIINDAGRHRLVITVSLQGISIERTVVQGSQAGTTRIFVEIPAPLDDCGFPAFDCETNLARHIDGPAVNGCFYVACMRHVGPFATGATITSTTTATSFQSVGLLDRSVHQQPNSPNEDNAYCFDSTAGLFVAGAPVLPAAFILRFETILSEGATGYLFSRSDVTGAQTFATYVSAEGLRVTYLLADGSQETTVVPDAAINDGIRHVLSIQLQETRLTVELDGTAVYSGQGALSTRIAPCAEGCVTFLAQTQGTEANPGGIDALHGCFFSAQLEFAGAYRVSDLAFELLDPAHHDGAIGPTGDAGRYCFEGAGVTLQPPLPRASSIFSLSMQTLFSASAFGWVAPALGSDAFVAVAKKQPHPNGLIVCVSPLMT